MGPVQVLVVGLDRPRFSGEVLAELTRLGKAGIVRLVDLFLVSRAEDGTFETLDPPDGVPADLGRVAAAVLGVPEDEANADAEPDVDARSGDVAAWSLADAVPPGSAAAVALIEQLSAELVARYWLDLFNAGRLRTVRGWLDEMGYEAIAAHAVAALTAGWVSGLLGEPEAMEHWLTTAELGGCDGPLPDGTASLESGVAMIRGLFGYSGLEARREYLVRALDLEGTASAWRPWLLWGLGHVALLSGDPMSARELFRDVLRVADPRRAVLTMIALAELALAESNLGDTDAATIHARRGEMIANQRGLASDSRSSSVWLALGCVLVAQGEVRAGHEAMDRALQLRRGATGLSPWPTLEVLLALAPVRFTLGDPDGAADLLAEARAILADLPDAGDLSRRLDEGERQLGGPGRDLAMGETLTDREFAILKLLPSQLSQRQIGGELFLSLNTVKSHSRAIYRKLGVSSREQAIEQARKLALL